MPVLMTVHFPIAIAVVLIFSLAGSFDCGSLVVVLVVVEVVRVRTRSPRRRTSGMRIVRPARVMFWVPIRWARRETLLPESCVQFGCG